MGYEPPTHKYTPEAFFEAVQECIRKCKDKDDEYIACPEQLYRHVGLKASTISGYRNLEKYEGTEYQRAADDWYNYMGIEGFKDLKDGRGTYGNTIIGKVLKYSEVQKIDAKTEHSGKLDMSVVIQDALKKANE
jgi:hypothetical protein